MIHESSTFSLERTAQATVVRIQSADGMNRLTRTCVLTLTRAVADLSSEPQPLILAGNSKFFSVGADLSEIAALTGPAALEFSTMGQALMNAIEQFPAPVYAAIEGYCMGGGLDLALACHHRIASPNAIFGHRGTALGLITGWGGTQRLPRTVGKPRALEILITSPKIPAGKALHIGLVEGIADNPLQAARRDIGSRHLQLAQEDIPRFNDRP
jgi:enoyl-CoA hydratase/carnithine racemase